MAVPDWIKPTRPKVIFTSNLSDVDKLAEVIAVLISVISIVPV
jgi:hypothetical protein